MAPPPDDLAANEEPRLAVGRAADILAKSIGLFNTHGVQTISSNRIAAELGISPGNLHYHFRRKHDILVAAYEEMERNVSIAISDSARPFPASKVVDWQSRLILLLWRYRFIFSSLDYFLQRAPALLGAYTAFQGRITEELAAAHDARVAEGVMIAVAPPDTTLRVAENLWMLWIAWIRWEMINSQLREDQPADEQDVEHAVTHRLLLRTLSVYGPYLSRRAAAKIAEDIERFAAGDGYATAFARMATPPPRAGKKV